MKKRNIIVFAVSILIALFFVFMPYIKTRMYFKNRITGHINILINGVETELSMIKYITPDSSDENTLVINNGIFELKGGEYGQYEFIITISNDVFYSKSEKATSINTASDTVIKFNYINSNWWNITDMFLKIEMNENDGDRILTLSATYAEASETYKESTMKTVENNYYMNEIDSDYYCTFGLQMNYMLTSLAYKLLKITQIERM